MTISRTSVNIHIDGKAAHYTLPSEANLQNTYCSPYLSIDSECYRASVTLFFKDKESIVNLQGKLNELLKIIEEKPDYHVDLSEENL